MGFPLFLRQFFGHTFQQLPVRRAQACQHFNKTLFKGVVIVPGHIADKGHDLVRLGVLHKHLAGAVAQPFLPNAELVADIFNSAVAGYDNIHFITANSVPFKVQSVSKLLLR